MSLAEAFREGIGAEFGAWDAVIWKNDDCVTEMYRYEDDDDDDQQYQSICSCSYLENPRPWDFSMLISQSYPYKPPSMYSGTRGEGYNFSNILRCAKGISNYIDLCRKRKRGEINCKEHYQEILDYSNSLIMGLLLGIKKDIKNYRQFIRGYKALDKFQEQMKKIISIAKLALIKELEELFPVRLPSLVLSIILDSLLEDFSFARELENEINLKLQDTIFSMYETFNLMISPGSLIPNPSDGDLFNAKADIFKKKAKDFPKLRADFLSILNKIGSQLNL